ncbi:murein biosynthesis integral membrane protein MurJ [Peribacillus acanthi]|uniref:murein biosynthesis integral membrane protein MurJ n=1 Tax=Peribacillus acanthi TaxID=2171554 RepID=UPI000D3E3C6D|nr:lipid II flippase MurJ [Peribacillus acanthi]
MSTLKKTAIWITLLALFLKLSGFLRESIVARQFGATEFTDGYLLAFSFITLIVAMISGGFNNVFLPMYVKHKKDRAEETERNANGVMNATVMIFLVVSVVGAIFVPYFVPFIFGNMSPTTEEVAVKMTRLFFYAMSGIALNGILESYLQGRRIFVPAQISKILATLMGAVFAILFSEQMGIYSLGYGFIFGTVVGIFIQFYYLLKSGFSWSPTLLVETDFRKAFIALIIPSLLNSVVGQINMFVNKAFASGTGDGAVTYLNNASLLVAIPNTIYATTIAAIIFTLLSEQVDDKKKFQNTMHMGMMISLVTLLPIAVGLFLLGKEALTFIYQGGEFTAADTQNTYIALVLYLPMIVAQGLQFIVSKSMYARGKTATIFKISVTTIALNALLNWLIVDDLGYPGLAVTSSAVAIYYLTISSIVVYKDFERSEITRLLTLFVRVLVPTLLMAVPIYLLKEFTIVGELHYLIRLVGLGLLGVVLYVAGLYLFYREAFRQLLALVRRKKGQPNKS